ncbi:MAG: ribosome biogenesis GTPase Der [Desulfovibrio sp.]|nr:ribosome biogenesis GTPase Der [Desulfovibrio sp.]
MPANLPRIVLLGRPNVGKSTLFNRLIKSNRAITHDRPGITRDRMEGTVKRDNESLFCLVDTGGLTLLDDSRVEDGPEGLRGFEEDIFAQVQAALAEASAIAFVLDGQDGLLPLDGYLASLARKANLPVLCVVNKVDGGEHAERLCADFHALGFPLIPVSAAHGLNIPRLVQELDAMVCEEREALHGNKDVDDPCQGKAALRLALLGRPNAGKSSLVNRLAGADRMITSSIAGTTRDSVDVPVVIGGEEYVFVDTAGVRRKTKIHDSVERFSVNASIKSTTKADVTILVLDAAEGLGVQDKRLIDLLDRRKTPFIIVVNKQDLLSSQEKTSLRKDLQDSLAFCSHVPVLTVSAKTGSNVHKILPLAREVRRECTLRVPTGKLNRAMEEVLARHQPPMVKHARPKFFYLTQAESEPPTFVFFVSDATRVPESYMRYLERGLRKSFALRYAPLRMHLRSTHRKKVM